MIELGEVETHDEPAKDKGGLLPYVADTDEV